jgi:hypothetical protein
VDDPSDSGVSLPSDVGEELNSDMADERNPLDMTEEEIAEAHGQLPPERRAMSVLDSLSQPAGDDEIPTDAPEDQPPAS